MRLNVIDHRESFSQALELQRELERTVDGEVRFSPGDRALYATDSSNYRQVPVGVVVPRSIEAVVATVNACHRHAVPIVSRGAGTSLAGQCCNAAVVLDHSKYLNRVLDLDPRARTARTQAGCVLDTLRHLAIREHGLTFGPDPSTHAWCTLGGMIGNNSCGVHSVMAGRTSDCTLELEVVTHDGVRLRVGQTPDAELERRCAAPGREGEIYRGLRALRDRYAPLIRARYPKIPRRVSGYNLDELLPENGCNVAQALVGSEGTCAVVLEATVRLIPWPKKRVIAVLGYPDIYSAGDHVPVVMAHHPIGLEGIDKKLISYMKDRGLHTHETELLPEAGGWLLAEFGGDSVQEAQDRARAMVDAVGRAPNPPRTKLFAKPDQERHIWDVRESGLGATAFVKDKPDAWEGWEDAAIPPDRVGDYLRAFRKLLNRYGYDTVMYGHFGQGCIHCRIDFDLYTQPGVAKYRAFINEAADLVTSFGGSLSGEHGDGQSKAAMLGKMYGPELLEAFREFKRLWDPSGLMNPGKVVDPYPPDSNLRLGPGYRPREVQTHFSYPDDRDSFGRATLRCVGVGKCRRNEDAFMCPTYRATMEEKHTTRGRAHLLFEMMQNDVLRGGWREEAVRESLDLCIGCKGCKSECPVHVDIATYKSEFLAHYYRGRLRPRSHYAMGLIGWWARLGASAPAAANFFGQRWPFSAAAKWMAGVSPHRRLPVFAPQTFRAWARTAQLDGAGSEVLLYPDLFNDTFYPGTLRAGARVLARLGYRVVIPAPLPSPRPLIHYGMLRTAKVQLRRLVSILRPFAERGTPIVGFEPSSVAVLREELTRLLPQDQDAQRICKLTSLFSEFVGARSADLPALGRSAVLHIHCHEKATLNPQATRDLLSAMAIDFAEPEKGCCGMAGSFGFEREHHELSMRIGEQNLLPATRRADAQTLLIAPGFSCRTQIHDATGRMPLHPAEVVELAFAQADGSASQGGG